MIPRTVQFNLNDAIAQRHEVEGILKESGFVDLIKVNSGPALIKRLEEIGWDNFLARVSSLQLQYDDSGRDLSLLLAIAELYGYDEKTLMKGYTGAEK
jgi:hypothetical protein